MSSNKRRKVDLNPVPKNLSAFAARRLRVGKDVTNNSQESRSDDEKPTGISGKPNNPGDKSYVPDIVIPSVRAEHTQLSQASEHSNNVAQGVTEPGGNMSDVSAYEQDEEDEPTAERSREYDSVLLSHRPTTQMSTIKPSKDNIKEFRDGSLSVSITAGERLVVLGQYGLSVVRGRITVLGATLSASKNSYQVYALSSHSLPVIRCSDDDGSEIRLYQCENGLRSLKELSPLFHRLRNEGQQGLSHSGLNQAEGKFHGNSTYHIIYSSMVSLSKAFATPVISPPEWNEIMAVTLSGRKHSGAKAATMVCGPKSSGKSTFAKLLINRLLSEPPGFTSNKRKPSGVALLDIDPGQPEYAPPGQLSLVHVLEPNFGPPYSHPSPSCGKNKLIRAHSTGAVSPSADPDLYMSCVRDLLHQYEVLSSSYSDCPLVINTPGWILGTGLEILINIIKAATPTEVIYMSTEGPVEVVKSLREVATNIPILTMPSQPSEYTTRTSAHLRTMQLMSYFHLENDGKSLSWHSKPLSSIPPVEVRYSGKQAGIMGIMCLGEQPPPEMLAATINGTILSVAVIDTENAVRFETEGMLDERNQSDHRETSKERDDCPGKFWDMEQPLIVESPEGIPYFNPAKHVTLDPRTSRSLGLALVRGIETEHKRLQLLTPIPLDIITESIQAGSRIVLISNKLDTPAWAYTEEFNSRASIMKRDRTRSVTDSSDISDEGGDEDVYEGRVSNDANDYFEEVPWIEQLQGHEGRGVGARVWRVRRDLGKTGDGGQ